MFHWNPIFIVFVLSVILSFCPPLWNFNLAYNFEQWVLELWYFTWVFLVMRPFHGYLFCPVTLTLEFDPFFENFNLSYNFWTVSARALIFHMSISCDKTFQWVPLFMTLWPWPWSLTNFLKTLTFLITFEKWVLYCTWTFLVTRSSYWYKDICHYRGHLCYINTSC